MVVVVVVELPLTFYSKADLVHAKHVQHPCRAARADDDLLWHRRRRYEHPAVCVLANGSKMEARRGKKDTQRGNKETRRETRRVMMRKEGETGRTQIRACEKKAVFRPNSASTAEDRSCRPSMRHMCIALEYVAV